MSDILLFALRAVLVILLYAFLGGIAWLLWQDLRQQSALLASRRTPPITLSRADSEYGEPRRFHATEVTIGRDPSSDLALDDQTISARHTRLVYRQEHWWAEDLGSTNGTYLNEQPVEVPAVLTSGDHLRCGQVVLQIAIDGTDFPHSSA